MSPKAKRWTKIGSSTLGLVALTGASMLPMLLADQPEKWLEWIRTVGLPTVLLIVVVGLIVAAVKEVWDFTTPHISSLFEENRIKAQKQGEFAEKASLLLEKSQQTDETHSILLKETHEMTRDIHGVIVRK